MRSSETKENIYSYPHNLCGQIC